MLFSSVESAPVNMYFYFIFVKIIYRVVGWRYYWAWIKCHRFAKALLAVTQQYIYLRNMHNDVLNKNIHAHNSWTNNCVNRITAVCAVSFEFYRILDAELHIKDTLNILIYNAYRSFCTFPLSWLKIKSVVIIFGNRKFEKLINDFCLGDGCLTYFMRITRCHYTVNMCLHSSLYVLVI